jgi:hypothetical protein
MLLLRSRPARHLRGKAVQLGDRGTAGCGAWRTRAIGRGGARGRALADVQHVEADP